LVIIRSDMERQHVKAILRSAKDRSVYHFWKGGGGNSSGNHNMNE
jgi:hypothetical protein